MSPPLQPRETRLETWDVREHRTGRMYSREVGWISESQPGDDSKGSGQNITEIVQGILGHRKGG